jgi:hypothetical protein
LSIGPQALGKLVCHLASLPKFGPIRQGTAHVGQCGLQGAHILADGFLKEVDQLLATLLPQLGVQLEDDDVHGGHCIVPVVGGGNFAQTIHVLKGKCLMRKFSRSQNKIEKFLNIL